MAKRIFKPAQLDQELAGTVKERITDRSVAWVVVAGKMLAGKDSVAPLILPALGYTDVVRVGYSDPMKKELQALFDLLRTKEITREALPKVVHKTLGYSKKSSEEIVEELFDKVQARKTKMNAWARTALNRDLLQKVGSTWRADNGEEYWPTVVTNLCLKQLAQGKSVYLTGGRFEPDVRIPQEIGALIIRLDITQEEQLRRLYERDGIGADISALEHPSEVALDNWSHFDVRILNDFSTPEECVNAVVKQLEEKGVRA